MEKGETSYAHMMMLDRDVISDSDNTDGETRLTIFADRIGNEYAKRCVQTSCARQTLLPVYHEDQHGT
eukprot:4539891-Amphidinium_carterae.1